MNVVIFEDETYAADHLERMLLQLEPDIRILAKISTIRKGVEWLRNNTCDLIFLDINLADGSCFEIFKFVQVNTPVIFTTAYLEYALKAFEINSVDYLLKPITIHKLKTSLEKFHQIHNPNKMIQNLSEMISKMANPETAYRERFSVEMGDKIKTVDVENIAYFFSMDKNTYFRDFNGHLFNSELSLDKISDTLNPKLFFRVNRNYIIQLKAVSGMHVMSNRAIKITLTPETTEEVMVSIARLGEFKQWLNR